MGSKRYSDYVRPLGRVLYVLPLIYYCYTDDTQAAKSFEPTKEHTQVGAVKELQYGINEIAQLMRANRFKLNRDKT